MSKALRDLQEQILQKSAAARKLLEGPEKDVEKAQAILNEVNQLQAEVAARKQLDDLEKAHVPTARTTPTPDPEAPKAGDATQAFLKAFRARAMTKYMNEGTDAAGGYTVPEDISTQINHWVEAHATLLPLISVERVNALTGARTYQKRATCAGFAKVDEAGVISEATAPQFERLTYTVSKYAGFMPVTAELLADSDANILNILIEWLGQQTIATDNREILALVKNKTAVAATGLDDIKKALTVTLGLYRAGSRVITNDSGLAWLDTLKDANSRYLLSASPANPMQLQLAAGATVYPVTVLPDAILPNETSGALPFILGDLNEYCRKYDRALTSVAQSSEATVGSGDTAFNLFSQDMIAVRAIMRADYKVLDANAIVRLALTPAAAVSGGSGSDKE